MDASSSDIAVVGMQCRVPGADGVEEFWGNLLEGRESISTFTPGQLRAAGVPAEEFGHPDYVPRGGVLRGVEDFDAEYFGLSPREAELLDPQQRLLLELAVEALQRAGHDPGRFPGTIGIYAGVGFPGYLVNNVMSHPEVLAEFPMLQIVMSGDKDYAATRVAYKLDLRGPAVTVQSACSTSLVAVHLAVQALLNGETDLALAGGASVYPSGWGYRAADGGLLSPDGHCRPFDAESAGTVPGSGAGLVVLRRLEDALADGDTVHAVIKGTAVNNDGSAKVGYTAPSRSAQARVIAEALAVAGAGPETIGYVEAHGAATALGDPIELAALSEVFATSGARAGSCALGSVKSNVGHLDAAAGVTGLIKTILTVRHAMIPPTLHYTRPNPHTDLDATPFYIPTAATPWPDTGTPRRAGTSSFGMGGTNAHIVIEQAPTIPPASPTADRPHVLTLSAKTPQALDDTATRLAQHLTTHPHLPLPHIAHTHQTGHPHHPHRRIIIASTTPHATTLLTQADPARAFSDHAADRPGPVVFLFPGVGDHYLGIAGGLYRHEPVFREEFDTCARILRPLLGTDLTTLLAPQDPHPADDGARLPDLRATRVAQPFAFALGYALAQLYRHYGVEPAAVGGYSIGEYVALCVAGALPLQDVLQLVARRATLIDGLPGGSMLAVLADTGTLEPYLADLEDLWVSAVDGPMLTMVSGTSASVGELSRRLTDDGLASRTLPASHAFHSPMMAPAADGLRDLAAGFRPGPLRIPVLSNVTGSWLRDTDLADPGYFARHLTQPVRFADNVAEIWGLHRAPVVVELGPGQTLGSLAMQHPARSQAPGGLVLPSLPGAGTGGAAADDLTTLRGTLGRMWLRGTDIHWQNGGDPADRRRVVLPGYPFQRRRHWLAPRPAGAAVPAAAGRRRDPADWFYLPSWRRALPPALRDDDKRPFLVLARDEEFGTALASALRGRGTEVTLAVHRRGTAPRRDGSSVYRYDAGQTDQVAALLGLVEAAPGGLPLRLVHAAAGGDLPDGPEDVLALLFLAQVLAEGGQVAERELTVVTAHGQSAGGGAEIVPAAAMLAGASRVLGQELPELRTRTVDVSVPPAGSGMSRLAEAVATELSAEPAETAVLLRGAQRWTQTFEPVRLPPGAGFSAVREGGTYLLIGGLGPVGQVVARRLAAVPGVKLAFVQRTPMPSAQDRRTWTPGADERLDYAVAGLDALEAAGAQVWTATADITDPVAMSAAIAEAERRLGPLNGVVHSAGTVGAGAAVPLPLVDRAACERHFASKVRGLEVLADCLGDRPLDFVLLNSSIASVLGGIGYFPYAAANCHMDAFAQRRSADTGVPWTSVNWEGWVLGESRADDTNAATLAEFLIDDAAGEQVVARVLGNPLVPQLVVSTGPLADRVAQWVTGAWRLDDAAADALPDDRTVHDRPALQTAYRDCSDELEVAIRDMWQQLLGIRGIGVDDSFFALGGHSLIATRVVVRVGEELGVHVPLHTLLAHPTIAGLAAEVRQARDRVDSRRRSAPITAAPRTAYRAPSADTAAEEAR